jgi:transcriptional regulator with XRE-family HTH domain
MSITLKAARVNQNLTQAKAAKKLGIAVDTLRQYEAGNPFPDVPMIKKIERLYAVSYNDINFSCNEKTVKPLYRKEPQ